MTAGATTSLARDFMLAVYLDGRGRVPSHRTGLNFGLSGAVLMEPALGGFIRIVDGHAVAVDGAQPRDRVLREVLVRIRVTHTGAELREKSHSFASRHTAHPEVATEAGWQRVRANLCLGPWSSSTAAIPGAGSRALAGPAARAVPGSGDRPRNALRKPTGAQRSSTSRSP
ncbi:hypothetical protein A4E84_35900 [Streptomyces qaidamensis]|uniref:Uncharacterized protein n=1 Tax=Streptomyces qaidamensis TaxID=1783515 RepID=A0A143CAI9_9ACTN|nr:hypothetical protein A4E84_35900 [Streptomyces qaidamensis]